MSVTVSKRKKYVRPMTATWWQKLDFYKAYMVREATSIFAVWFCIVLLYGVLCLASNPVPVSYTHLFCFFLIMAFHYVMRIWAIIIVSIVNKPRLPLWIN